MQKKQTGFTLIELLVVIAIVALLAGLVMVNLAGIRERARDTQRKSDLNEVKKALRLYYNDNERYPGTLDLSTNDVFTHPTNLSMVYMKSRPTDPLETQLYRYYQNTITTCGISEFRLTATLENASDPDILKSQSRCSSVCGFTATNHSYVVCPD